MGKRSRKSKAKKSDFQKVKLKVGKRKPLPNNVTEVAFKSQGLYIPEQLKNVDADHIPDDDEFSRRKQNVTELLGQVGHFNTNNRTDALTALRVHLSNNKHLVAAHLPKIIEKTPKTMLDQDRQVRKSSITFFKVLFSCLTEKQISPFFNIILSHLYCAMSHIYDDVQRDSLQMVDLCVEDFPNLITKKDRNSILHHFIEMISTKQMSSAADKTGSKNVTGPTRILSMKLSSKESSISWRIKVLRRLFAILQTSESSENRTPFRPITDKHEVGDYDAKNGFVVSWNSDRIGDLLTSFHTRRLEQSPMSLKSNKVDLLSSINFNNESLLSPWKLITTLFPLLFDCWHEVVADEKKTLTTETVSTMMYVLKIVILLCKRYIEASDEKLKAIFEIRSTFAKQFGQYFLSSFPLDYQSTGAGEKRERKRRKVQKVVVAPNLQADIQIVNLSICELVTLLAVETELHKDAEILSLVALYVSSLLVTEKMAETIDEATLKQIMATKRRLLDIAADKGTVENLLHPLLIYYHKVAGPHKTRILQFFLDLYSREGGHRSAVLQNNLVMLDWIRSLPDLLMAIIPSDVKQKVHAQGDVCPNTGDDTNMMKLILSCMRLASLRKSQEYAEAMKSRTTTLLCSLQNAAENMFCPPSLSEYHEEVSWCRNCATLQAQLFEVIVFHSPALSRDCVVLLTGLCHHVTISVGNIYYVAEMIKRKMLEGQPTKHEQVDNTLLTFKLFCSIILGTTKEDLQSLQGRVTEDNPVSTFYQISGLCSESSVRFERHNQIALKLCQLLPTLDHVYTFLQPFLCEKLLGEYTTFPVETVVGILRCGGMLLALQAPTVKAERDLKSSLGKLCASSLMECGGPQELEKNTPIVKTVKKIVVELFKAQEPMLRSCIEHLASADMTSQDACKTICLVTDELLLNVTLHKELSTCRETVKSVFTKMMVQCDGVESSQWFKNAINNSSIMLRSGKS